MIDSKSEAIQRLADFADLDNGVTLRATRKLDDDALIVRLSGEIDDLLHRLEATASSIEVAMGQLPNNSDLDGAQSVLEMTQAYIGETNSRACALSTTALVLAERAGCAPASQPPKQAEQ